MATMKVIGMKIRKTIKRVKATRTSTRQQNRFPDMTFANRYGKQMFVLTAAFYSFSLLPPTYKRAPIHANPSTHTHTQTRTRARIGIGRVGEEEKRKRGEEDKEDTEEEKNES